MQTFIQWKAGSLSFLSQKEYENPFLDPEIYAIFTGPNGEMIRRDAYWDGGKTYRVSFAPTEVGSWSWKLFAPKDSGLDGQAGSLWANPYTGSLEIYKHGFLKVSSNHAFLSYADDIPFFWLGDTHWGFVSGEKWDTSNHPKMSSMFKGMVDRRVEQGYTVYQTNLHADPAWGTHFWEDGQFGLLPDIRFFQQVVDKRMYYIAEAGLVNALGFDWNTSIIGNLDVYKHLARYIVARYGALPIVWTLAGEVASYDRSQRETCIQLWREVALEVERKDGYNHLQTAHYTSERPLADYYYNEGWFDFTLNQCGHGGLPIYASFQIEHRQKHPDKPFIEGESMYEFVSTLEPNGARICTAEMVRRCAYLAMQSGAAGYTYGAQGIWDTVYDKPEKPDPKNRFNPHGIPWYEAIDGEAGYQMGYMRKFYESLPFSDLKPLQAICRTVVNFSDGVISENFMPCILSLPDLRLITAYYTARCWTRVPLIGLPYKLYRLSWFNPRNGETIDAGIFPTEQKELLLPEKPGIGDWMLKIEAV